MTIDSILKIAAKENVTLVETQFTDLLGDIKSVSIRVELLEDALNDGIWFDGSSIAGFMDIHESDLLLKPDPETFRILPWWNDSTGKVARLLCDIYTPDGEPFTGDPRYILKKMVAKAEKMGYVYNVGPELEFFLFPMDENGEPIVDSRHNGAYFELSRDELYEVKKAIINALQDMGISVETSHYEVADRQHEIDFRFADALSTADNAVTFKYVVKQVAAEYGYHATFMPKPTFGLNGSGMHCHQSLSDVKTGKNAFADKKDLLSPLARQFMAGLLSHVREISGVIAPTVNSYKRLTPGYEAPVYACWAKSNRSALIRVPRIIKGKEAATRFELRCPDPSSNPYLAFAVMLAAGLLGIEKKMACSAPVEENLFEATIDEIAKKGIETVPSTLGEAVSEMRNGSLVRTVLSTEVFERYINLKQAEWDEFRISVTDWERKRYLSV